MKPNKSEVCCFFDYKIRCDCAEDDNCGCSFPNNLESDVICKELTNNEKSDTLSSE